MKEQIIDLYENYKEYVGDYGYFGTWEQKIFRNSVIKADESKLKTILETILEETQEEFDESDDMEVMIYQTEFTEMLDLI